MYDLEDYDYDLYYPVEEEEIRWTRRRIILAVVAFITLLIFVLYMMWPFINVLIEPGPPQPTPPPAPMV